MADRTCSVAGCERPHAARGYCKMHYQRWRLNGDPGGAELIYGDDEARFWSKVDKRGPDECWPWTACLARGYGWFYDGSNPKGRGSRGRGAHRVAYEMLVGPVPEGMDLDHTCHNATGCPGGASCVHRRCVNPAHLEPVTRRVNLVRGARSTYWSDRTHCKYGHEYTAENTRMRGSTRICRACERERRAAG